LKCFFLNLPMPYTPTSYTHHTQHTHAHTHSLVLRDIMLCSNIVKFKFPKLPRHFRKCLGFPQLPRQFWKCRISSIACDMYIMIKKFLYKTVVFKFRSLYKCVSSVPAFSIDVNGNKIPNLFDEQLSLTKSGTFGHHPGCQAFDRLFLQL
jgi:hypothetical protein